MEIRFFCLFIFVLLFAVAEVFAQKYPALTNLRVEYKTNPMGIDIENPRLSWEILSDKQNTTQTAFEILFAESMENIVQEKDLLWKLKVDSDQSIHNEYKGPALESRQKIYWKVRVWDNLGRVSDWSEIAFWEIGLLIETDWKAKWIEGNFSEDNTKSQPAQYFRRSFELGNNIKSARLYITSHGLYEAFINGKRVGDQVFTPGWTSYNKRLQYQTYDVTDLLMSRGNALGITVGDGWYRGFLGWRDNKNVYGEKLGLLAQLEIEYSNGDQDIILTDGRWKVTNEGPIRMSDIYMGEKYDGRKELKTWSENHYDDSTWEKIIVKDLSKNILIAPQGPPVRKIESVTPINIITKDNGKYIFDMGQNMVGWVRLKVNGPSGTKVTLRHAEVLDKYGEFYIENLRAAKQTTEYILNGSGEEIFEPHFTFQGFRFVEIAGYPGVPDKESLTGIVIHSDMTPTGFFECSDSLLNQLQHNIVWGLKGNFLDVPTDCPQRDERMGWTGDAQVFAPTACFNMDAAGFYTKWLKDLAADQSPDGKVGDVIPNVLNGQGGHTGWGDAATVIPWTLYTNYGDKRILEEQYESMKAWVLFMKEKAGEDYLWTGDSHYGDWLAFASTSSSYAGAYTETDLIATAYFAYSAMLTAKSAEIIGKEGDASELFALADKIKSAFYDEFVTSNGRLVSNTQTAYTLALALDILPEKVRPQSAEYLFQNVDRFKHITTGFLGAPLINPMLTEFGYLDLAYLLLNRKEYPSWLYPITMGATTIWERWDGIKPDSTFQNKGMNSFNHYAYGAIGKWLYSTVAGIDNDEDNPGYKNIMIKPQPGGGLTHAAAEINTMYGKASSSWKIEGVNLKLTVTIPVNTSGSIFVNTDSIKDVRINGQLLKEQSGIKIFETENKILVGSGTYAIEYQISNR